jgi:hypothetical protein
MIMAAIQKMLKIKLHNSGYLHQYHSSNPWTDLLSHSQHGEPGHVSWGILQDPFAENTKQHCCNPSVQVPCSHYKLCCKSTNITTPIMKAEWQTAASKLNLKSVKCYKQDTSSKQPLLQLIIKNIQQYM